ncbi:MAG: hypothetical protein AAFN77_19830 [Planctomycetota bacterium]
MEIKVETTSPAAGLHCSDLSDVEKRKMAVCYNQITGKPAKMYRFRRFGKVTPSESSIRLLPFSLRIASNLILQAGDASDAAPSQNQIARRFGTINKEY